MTDRRDHGSRATNRPSVGTNATGGMPAWAEVRGRLTRRANEVRVEERERALRRLEGIGALDAHRRAVVEGFADDLTASLVGWLVDGLASLDDEGSTDAIAGLLVGDDGDQVRHRTD